jgi:hypothetical protein
MKKKWTISKFTEWGFKIPLIAKRLTSLWITSSTEDAMSIWYSDILLSRHLFQSKIGIFLNVRRKMNSNWDLKIMRIALLQLRMQKVLGLHSKIKLTPNRPKSLLTENAEEQLSEMQKL